MKRVLFLAAAIAAAVLLTSSAFAQVHVRGYYRSNGTYVAPHWRSSPDHSYNNNWSVSPNVNPYTGVQGTRQPTWNDRAPSSNSLRGLQQLARHAEPTAWRLQSTARWLR